MLRFVQRFSRLLLFSASAVVALAVVACNQDNSSHLTSPAAGDSVDAAADGSTLKIPAPTLVSPTNGTQLEGLSTVTLTISNVSGTYTFISVTYEIEVKNPAGTVIANPKFAKAGGSTTSFTLTTTFPAETTFSWRARATSNGHFGPWSSTGNFKTGPAAFRIGNTVLDPLITGSTVGFRHGGHFVTGQGWQSDSVTDGIDYDLTACPSCKFEFDITNVGNGLLNFADLKFFTMGDGSAFSDFGTFTASGWKMTLELRGDGDGTGMKIIWRVNNDDDDHQTISPASKVGGPFNSATKVYHIVTQWTPSSYQITVDGVTWFSGSLQGPYVPPNFRITLGEYSRGETLVGAIWRNVKIGPQ
jgi:hypothetical protein